MDYKDLKNKMIDLAKAGRWDESLRIAAKIPKADEPYYTLANGALNKKDYQGLHKILDNFKGNEHDKKFFANHLSEKLPQDIDNEFLHKLFHFAPEGIKDTFLITTHPNYKLNDEQAGIKRVHEFFRDYEREPSPAHFATVKSYFTGKPEEVRDHLDNQKLGISDPELLPHMRNYSKAIQDKILKDDKIPKIMIDGEPHVQLHRAVGRDYGKAIRNKIEFSPITKTAKSTSFTIPTAYMTSWSLDPAVAEDFIMHNDRWSGESGHGVVISQPIPVKDIIHSSTHLPVVSRSNPYFPQEKEILVGHPEGKHKISTEDLSLQSNDSHFTIKPTLIKSEDGYIYFEEVLCKSVKNTIAAATVASMIGTTTHPDADLKLQDIKVQHKPITQIKHETKLKANPELHPISMIESHDGLNVNHPIVDYGLNAGTSAYGKYGIMPLQALEIVKLDKNLSNNHSDILKMHHLKDQDDIKKYIKENNLEDQLANSHWNRLAKKFNNDTNRMAYAWKNGITAALSATKEEVDSHGYVKKYNQYKALNKLKNSLGKTEFYEPILNKAESTSISSFIALKDEETSKDDVFQINKLISEHKIKDLSNFGHFTHDSFVVGFEKDNSWLIKIDQKGRPAIESVKYGLQSIKEAAFYQCAKLIFGLEEYTPKTILGEIQIGEERKTCVAVKMYSDVYIPAVNYNKEDHNSMAGIVNQYIPDGTLHKLSAMMWILGDLDGHGKNVLTNGFDMKLIDHGSSFANMSMNVKDKDAFIPYFLRIPNNIKDSMTDAEKLDKMPKVHDIEVNKELKHWIFALDIHKLLELLNIYDLDNASAVRLEFLRKLIEKHKESNISVILNECWVYDWFKLKGNTINEIR